jgi:ABC-type polysaccharide/polyol phosphate transport system ATPase subunit
MLPDSSARRQPLLPSAPVSATIPGEQAELVSHPVPARSAAVKISHVSKTFKVPRERYHTLKERVLHPRRGRHFELLRAADDISVEIAEGEFFGIVGRNGSGKSTLLKCLAGIYDIDAGSIEICGRLSPFIELGVGFTMDLPARDNVIINATMLGLSRRQARERFDSIIAFAELEEFVDMKLKNFSSGMLVRLAFSTAVQVDADILLMDEVLAVGDASFQRKCFDEFLRLKAEGRTIIFVTHDMGAIERFCDRAMLIEHGRVVDIGGAGSIARQYNDLNFNRARTGELAAGAVEEPVARRQAELERAVFESPAGETIVSIPQGEPCCVRLEARFNTRAENPVFAISLRNEFGLTAFSANTELGHGQTGTFAAGELAIVRLRFDNCMAPGRYTVMASVTGQGPVSEILDVREDLSSIIVHTSGGAGGGVVDLPHTFDVERHR